MMSGIVKLVLAVLCMLSAFAEVLVTTSWTIMYENSYRLVQNVVMNSSVVDCCFAPCVVCLLMTDRHAGLCWQFIPGLRPFGIGFLKRRSGNR